MSSWITGELNDKIIINVEVTDDVFEIVMNNQRKAISKAVAEEREKAEKLVEALKRISNDKEFGFGVRGEFIRKVWYVEEAKRALTDWLEGNK